MKSARVYKTAGSPPTPCGDDEIGSSSRHVFSRDPAAFPVIFLAVFFLAANSLAGAGKDGFQFLASGAGARGAGMGDVGSSLGGDPESAFLNPGALSVLRAREVSFSHAVRSQGASDESLAFVQPFSSGAWGARAFTRSYGTITGYDNSGGPAPSYTAGDASFSAAYGRRFGIFGAGAAVKQVRETLAGRSAAATALDAGLFVPWRGTPLTISLDARNVGRGSSFDQEKTPLPRSVEGGVSGTFFSGSLTTVVQGVRSDAGTDWRAGAEVWMHNVLALRAGLDRGRDAGNGVTFGLGIRLKSLRVDYAFAPMGSSLGALHRMGISYRFGGAGESAYQRGLALAQRGDYAEAVLQFKEALDADPGNRDAVRGLREAIQNLKTEKGP